MATRRLEVEITGDARSLDKALGRATQRSDKFSRAVKIGATAAVGGLAVALTSSVRAAVDAERSQKQMEGTLKTLGISYGKHAKEIENVIQKTSKLAAVDDEELTDSFNKLVRATGDVNTALKETQLAADLARGANIGLEQATKLILNAEAGRVMGLQKYVGMLDKVTTAQDKVKQEFDAYKDKHKDLTDAEKIHWETLKDIAIQEDKAATSRNALRVTTEKFAGASEQFGTTTAGSVARAQVAWENFQEKLGTALLPVLNDVLEIGLKILAWMEENERTVRVFAAAIGVLSTAILAATVAQKAMNLAILANPYVAATAAVLALAAGMYLLWQRVEEARPAIVALAAAVSPLGVAIGIAWNKSEGFREAVRSLAPVLKGAATEALGAFASAANKAVSAIDKIVSGIRWIIDNAGKIPRVFGGGGDPGPGSSGGRFGDMKGADSVMAPFAASAAAHGLHVTSGLRPGATTRHGTPSDHAVGRALDVADGASNMAAFFKSLIGNRAVKQAFYDPLGSIFNGQLSSYREGGHSDHVHVATYDNAMRAARFLMPGLNVAYNGTGRPEPVGIAGMRGATVNVFVSGSVTTERDLVTAVRDGISRIGQRNDGTGL